MNIIQQYEADEIARLTSARAVPDFIPGDTVRVSVKVGLFATVHGTFADVTGHVDLAANAIDSRVDVTVATTSLTSGSACMDAILHGAGAMSPFVSRSRNTSRSRITSMTATSLVW